MVVLLISLVLGLLPLAGVVWIVLSGWMRTVDGLFLGLILLAISGIFFLNVLLELRQRRAARGEGPAKAAGANAPVTVAQAAPGGTRTQSGMVEAVAFYEAPVGQPDKSLVTLRTNGSPGSQMIVFQGDLRSVLPVGKHVTITYTGSQEGSMLVGVER